jgi:hypothetical protein
MSDPLSGAAGATVALAGFSIFGWSSVLHFRKKKPHFPMRENEVA